MEDTAGQSKKAGLYLWQGILNGFEEGTRHGRLDGLGRSLCKQWAGWAQHKETG